MHTWRSYLLMGQAGGFGGALLLGISAFITLSGEVYAQRRAWNWFFGQEAGLNFSTGSPVALADGSLNTEEGCASISDPASGKLLFYTDGVTVYNQLHLPMPNGMGLHGDESTSQSALIIQWPGSTDLYAIFTPAPVTASDPGVRCFCLKYSLVDMRRDGGYGDVVLKNELIDSDVTEHITAVPDCNQGGWWIIVRGRESTNFSAYHLSTEQLSLRPVVSSTVGMPEIRDAGQMHASPSGKYVVITSPSGTSQLYRIARSTGKLYNGINLFGSDVTGIHYGATFSRDSRYLYIASSVLNPQQGVVITRFDVSNDKPSAILASKSTVGFLPGSASFTAMQLGPDGMIYIGRYGERFLARIPQPSAVIPTIQDTAVALFGRCKSGLPNIINWYLSEHPPGDVSCKLPVALAADQDVCAGSPVRLIDGSQGLIDTWSWTIPGASPNSSRIPSPTVVFPEPGVYQATLTTSNVHGDDSITITITVHPPPSVEVLPTDPTCPKTPARLHATGASEYRWFPAAGISNPHIADPVAVVDTTTTYGVIGTDDRGCVDTAFVTIQVRDMFASANVTVCPGGAARLAAFGADRYRWSPELSLDDPTSATPVAQPSETTEYIVEMSAGNCTRFDTVVVFVEPSLHVSIEAPSEACSGDTIVVRATGGGSTFVWTGDGVEPSTTNETRVHLTSTTLVRVVAYSGACMAQDSLIINPTSGPIVEAGTDVLVCEGDSVLLQASGTASNYEWLPAHGLVNANGQMATVKPSVTTTYYVLGSGSGTCTSVDSVRVTVTPTPVVSAGPIKRICRGNATRLSATGTADEYRWEPTAGLSDATILAPIASPDTTTTYRLTAIQDGCVFVDSTTVFVSTLDITSPSSVRLCQGSAVQLMVSGAATYRWTPSDGLSDPTIPNPIASPRVSTTYEIAGVDAFGCEDRTLLTVDVVDTASVVLRASTISAEAGTDDLGIPVVVEVDPELLPMFADTLMASLIFPAEVFYPSRWDIGQPFFSIRGNERVTRLLQHNIQLVNPQQRINTLYGTVLSGSITTATLHWEDIHWAGLTCPSNGSTPSLLLVTGCNIKGRALRYFSQTSVTAVPRPSSSVIDVSISGDEPGQYVVQLVSTDGAMIHQHTISRAYQSANVLSYPIDMSSIARGLYYVVVTAPSGPYLSRVLWMP